MFLRSVVLNSSLWAQLLTHSSQWFNLWSWRSLCQTIHSHSSLVGHLHPGKDHDLSFSYVVLLMQERVIAQGLVDTFLLDCCFTLFLVSVGLMWVGFCRMYRSLPLLLLMMWLAVGLVKSPWKCGLHLTLNMMTTPWLLCCWALQLMRVF